MPSWSFRGCKGNSRDGSIVLNGNIQGGTIDEKKILRGISRRRQKERERSHILKEKSY
jgi:hypothetical protein